MMGPMKKIHPEYIFALCLLGLSLIIFVIGAAQGSFGGGVISVLLLWWADHERIKAAAVLEKKDTSKDQGE